MQLVCIALFIFLSNIDFICALKLKSCNPHQLQNCPLNSVCEEIDDSNGVCKCIRNYDFNNRYKNDTEYCLFNNRTSTTRTKLMRITTTTSTATTTRGLANSVTSSSASTPVSLPARSIPEPEHHIIGGILIPMVIVLMIIGAAYGVKRLEIVRRIREYQMRRRRQRPFYEDVMMSHENDEPPLI